jgi:hypothetical protein
MIKCKKKEKIKFNKNNNLVLSGQEICLKAPLIMIVTMVQRLKQILHNIKMSNLMNWKSFKMMTKTTKFKLMMLKNR